VLDKRIVEATSSASLTPSAMCRAGLWGGAHFAWPLLNPARSFAEAPAGGAGALLSIQGEGNSGSEGAGMFYSPRRNQL
jgi:hypothetical protein